MKPIVTPQLAQAQPNRGLLADLPEEVMTERHLRVKCDPVGRCGANNFEREGSVLDWRKGLPIGNGDFGAAIHGFPDQYSFHIAKNDVWWGNVDGIDPYPTLSFAELRERVAAGDVSVKHDIRRTTAERLTVETTPTGCARLSLQLCRAGTFYNVKEYLNMMNATASTEFCVSQNGLDGGPFWIQSFVSRLEEVLVVRLRPPQSLGEVRFELGRDALEPTGPDLQSMTRAEFDAKYQPRAAVDGALGWFTMPLSGGDSYTVMVASDSPALQLLANRGDIRGQGRPADGPVTLFVTVVSSHDAADTVAEARRRIELALAVGFDTICGEHGAWWSRFWRRSWVALPPGSSERAWYWGLYKAGSARRPGKVCPGYGAPWRKGNYLNWGVFCLNYEESKLNQGILPTNHAELLEPWIAVVHRAAERLKRTTERFYGLPGVCFPHAITWTGEPTGSTSPLYNSTTLSVNTTGEAVKCAWDYYDFTGDRDFLRRVGYPLLKAAALFYRAYLQEDEQGRLVIFPSRYNEYDSWCEALDDFMRNSVTDLAIFRFVLTHAAQAARVLDMDPDLAADWTAAAARLPEYATWPDGSIKPSADWIERGFHPFGAPEVMDLWPVSATGEVDAWHGSETRRAIFLTTYQKWLGNDPTNTWDRCFPFIAAARMGDRDYAAKILAMLQKLPEAGNINRGDPPDVGDQDGHSPFVVDAGSAFPAEVVTEFLLQSHAGDIRLFPAAPLTGHYAFHSLRARGAFLVSSEFRDGKVPYALIQSLRGNRCRVVNPFGATGVRIRDLDTGAVVLNRPAAVDEILEFATETGHVLVIEKTACLLEEVPVVNL